MRVKTLIGLAALLLSACGGAAVTQAPPRSNLEAFMGDSITWLWDLPKYDSAPALNFGVSGDTTVAMLARFQGEVIAAAPGTVVILGGINDLDKFGVAAANTDSIAAMAKAASAAGIRVVLCSVLPSQFQGQVALADIEAFNAKILDIAIANGYDYVDYYDAMLTPAGETDLSLFKDGLHPNDAGYARMWSVLAPVLRGEQ